MVQVQPVNLTSQTHQQNKYNPLKITGYGAAGFMAASIIQASRKKPQSHKILAFIATAFTLAHIGIIEYSRCKKKLISK